jgi:zinc protease
MPIAQAGLEPTRTALPNGVVVIARETRKTPAVTLNLAVKAGSACDPVDGLGAVHLLSRVIDRGTATRSALDIADQLDGCGVSLTTTVTRHVFSVTCTCLADDFEAILELAGDVLTAPRIPEAELATRRGEVITSLRQDEDNPAVRASDGVMALLYGPDHPYGRPAKGTLDSVGRITRDDLLRLHARRFAPSALTVVVVGDVAVHRVVEAVSRVLGGWRTDDPQPLVVPHAPSATERRVRVVSMPNKAQADIAYAFTTIARADKAYYALSLLNNALGQYALGGRLGDSIRERQGMAYYVASAFSANVVEGPLTIRAGVSGANVDRAVQSIDEELDRLLAEGLTERELTESRQYMIGSLPRALETNEGIAQFLQTEEFFDLGLDFDRRLPELLRSVTLDQTQELARRYLDPRRASIVIAGPYQSRHA